MAALPRSLHFPNPCPALHPPTRKLSHQNQTPPFLHLKRQNISLSLSSQSKLPSKQKQTQFTIRATENGSEAEKTTEDAAGNGGEGGGEDLSELGMEIKKAMKEREKADGLVSGVVEEIGEIEWPDFGKVFGTSGVVLGVIAGSSVVLLTVNAVLAELSDRVFAGKGVQDFFGG